MTGELWEELSFLLRDVARGMRSYMSRELPGEISPTLLWLLKVIETNEPVTMSEIARKMRSALSNITGLIDQLVNDGWAVRARDAGDRRVVVVELTEQGRKILRDARRHQQDALNSVFNSLEQKELEQLVNSMRRLAAVLEKKNMNNGK